ncbi:ATP-binding cassette domain-containing protein [Catellatospora coxensis]
MAGPARHHLPGLRPVRGVDRRQHHLRGGGGAGRPRRARGAAEAVGLGDLLAQLPLGLDTPLARHLTGGVDLSGGQWQRVALARALFALRHGAPVVVLDEPTASLDVRAEAQFFDEFAGLTQEPPPC